MKKLISLLLVVITLFAFTATAVFAEDATETRKPIAIMFFDDNGTTQVGETIYVDYGEDINAYANTLTFTHPDIKIDGVTYKVVHEGWKVMNVPYYTAQGMIPKGSLPAFYEGDRITEPVKIKAAYKEREKTLSNEFEDTITKLPGGEVVMNASEFFTTIIELIKKWITQFALYINAFLPKG